MKHALTIDVEDYFQVAAFKTNINPADWNGYKLRVESNTHRFLEIIDRHNVKATFFFLGWIAEKCPYLVRAVAEAGHEVCSHGYSHQLIYEQMPDVFREETHRSKSLLEDLVQRPIPGYRAASYSITPESLWALDIISEAGFSYDSSIYPVTHDNYGLQGGPHRPYKVALRNGESLVEFPITTSKIGPLTVPVGGGGYFRLYPYKLTRALLRQRLKSNDSPFVFYLHPWELDPHQPRVPQSSMISRFRHYNNLHKVESRLNRLLRDFEFAPMGEVLKQCEEFPEHCYT